MNVQITTVQAEVTIYSTSFKLKQYNILYTQFTCGVCVVIRRNGNSCSKYHYPQDFCTGEL